MQADQIKFVVPGDPGEPVLKMKFALRPMKFSELKQGQNFWFEGVSYTVASENGETQLKAVRREEWRIEKFIPDTIVIVLIVLNDK